MEMATLASGLPLLLIATIAATPVAAARVVGDLVQPVVLPSGEEVARGELLVYWSTAATNARERAAAAIQRMGGEILETSERHRLFRARFGDASAAAIEDFRSRLATDSAVALADFNSIGRAACSQPDNADAVESCSIPNDPDFPDQWHLVNTGQSGGTPGADINALGGWAIAQGTSNVVVAVLDTGIVLDHPELADRLVAGYDFANGDSDPYDDNLHGTYVSGILGADACNGESVAGLDHHCRLMPIKILNAFEIGTVFDLIQGLDFAHDQHVDVVNMSVYGWMSTPALKDALKALKDDGAILVAAAGNYGKNYADKYWPAADPNVITVGATDASDQRLNISGTGMSLDFVAPGQKVVTIGSSSDPRDPGIHKMTGTSAATPIVAGIVAVMRGLNPHASQDVCAKYLASGAADLIGGTAEDTPGWDPYYGNGRVDFGATMAAFCDCQGGDALIASPHQASLAAADVVALRIDAGREHAGQPYWIFGTASGVGQWSFGSLTLPLVVDDYTRFTISDANGAVLQNTHGLLDNAGQAMGFLFLPKGLSVPGPSMLNHVAVVFDGRAVPAHAVLATNVTTTLIEP